MVINFVFFFQVSSHEIYHVSGMAHCSYFACATNKSRSVLQAENQPLFLIRFVYVNHKKLLTLMLWKGTLAYVSWTMS